MSVLVAQVVEPEVVRELGEDQDDDVAPLVKGPGEVLGAVLANDLAEGVPGNVVANLLEDGMLSRCREGVFVMCLSSERRLYQLSLIRGSSSHCPLLWDACGSDSIG